MRNILYKLKEGQRLRNNILAALERRKKIWKQRSLIRREQGACLMCRVDVYGSVGVVLHVRCWGTH